MGIHKQFRKASSWIVALAVAGLGSGVAVGETEVYVRFTKPDYGLLKVELTRYVGQPTRLGSRCEMPMDPISWISVFETPSRGAILRAGECQGLMAQGVWRDVAPELVFFDNDGPWEVTPAVFSGVEGGWVLFNIFDPELSGQVFLGFLKDGGDGEDGVAWAAGDSLTVPIADDDGARFAMDDWVDVFGAGCYPIVAGYDWPDDVTLYVGSRCDFGIGAPSNYAFSAPNLPRVVTASKGSKNSVSLGNSGFAPIGNGMMIGVGYDRADNSVSNSNDANFDGNEYRLHLDLLKGHDNLFYGLAGEYRESKYTLADLTTKYKTKYYGPRVDLGYRGMDSWAQLSAGYYFGNGSVIATGDNSYTKFSNGYLAQLGLLAQMDKWLSHRFSLKPGLDVQYIWQKLGSVTLEGTNNEFGFKNRDYGRADFNLGLGIALVRGWDITPNVGYRWDIKSACTQEQGFTTKICEPNASGVRYGVQLAKAVMVTGSHWDELAVSAYWDYFKKSGVKQNVWGVMAQYPF